MALEDRFVDGCEIPGGTKYYILFTWYYIDEPHLHIGSEPSEIIGQVIYYYHKITELNETFLVILKHCDLTYQKSQP